MTELREVYKVPPEAEGYVTGMAVAVVVEGNDVEWQPEAYVWLPNNVAYELDEAGALNYEGEAEGKAESLTEETVTVFVYTLA